jgi:hypothetical protein
LLLFSSIDTVGVSTFAQSELLPYRTEPCYIGTSKKPVSSKTIWFAKSTVREKVWFVKKLMGVLSRVDLIYTKNNLFKTKQDFTMYRKLEFIIMGQFGSNINNTNSLNNINN